MVSPGSLPGFASQCERQLELRGERGTGDESPRVDREDPIRLVCELPGYRGDGFLEQLGVGVQPGEVTEVDCGLGEVGVDRGPGQDPPGTRSSRARTQPRSVTTALIRFAGVTSNAGL